MNIRFIVIGKTTEDYLKEGISEYSRRLSRYCSFTYEELVVKSSSTEKNHVLQKEAEKLLDQLKVSDHLILLDEKGTGYSSTGFATYIEQFSLRGTSSLVFAVGGAYGFHDTVYKRTNSKMALSQMTFTHQMVRLIFTEQLYRAFTIIKKEKYHH
jgi:23S rRNA (pseudouridine1915-N3)-methyltransferase